ncbi:dethiobiotin synthase [Pedobacter punctiformis]|uniref:ATP-dependent dethiobiotin synthetase BioD n=1 Tax=Pedobacter punctiformis TaxID=3004097 RepID=A0ABT4L7A0_9SPHI|nr:dethiobiotin synthase [Pedobacter sp. HCMS5-2]MCZ4243799.1 dethiobiotin synthase [Pedobacter sp. HCMS5-2]
MTKYFITGIGTGIGKTLISAILTEKLKADYWKPIQSGDLENSDSLTIESLISNTKTVIHPESYQLTQPLSPHLSAALDGIEIDLENIVLPHTENNLIVEGAGGLMVPLNETKLIVDLIKKLNVEVILVSQNYLGSINHTLLSVNLLNQYGIKIKGIIFNGDENEENQRYILQYSKLKSLGYVPRLDIINQESILSAGTYIQL